MLHLIFCLCCVQFALFCQPKVLKSVHHPLALKLPLMLREPHSLSRIQCLPSVTVSSSLGDSVFHQVTSPVLFLLIIRWLLAVRRICPQRCVPCSLDDQSKVAKYRFGHKRNIMSLYGEGGNKQNAFCRWCETWNSLVYNSYDCCSA